MAPASGLIVIRADSARVVGEAYGFSLLVTLLLVFAVVLAVVLRRASAGTRALAWRCAIGAVLAVIAGHVTALQWTAWVLPGVLAQPLIAIGGAQLTHLPGAVGGQNASSPMVTLLAGVYVTGVLVVALPTLAGRLRLAHVRRDAIRLDAAPWRALACDAAARVGLPATSIELRASRAIRVPVTWGVVRPVVLLPLAARAWPGERVRAVLLHELAHVRARDAAMLLAARVMCALCWFHPLAWWLARRFEADSEEACDDRVLLSGIRRSEYAEWLAASAMTLGPALPAMAFARGGLRRRLRAITDATRPLAMPTRQAMAGAVLATAVAVTPLSTVRLAPTRSVLTALMGDQRWESRAWAVIRLAQRPDSVEVARRAARNDPSPDVRAWARYALARRAPATPAARPD